jgi:hypothetical protein
MRCTIVTSFFWLEQNIKGKIGATVINTFTAIIYTMGIGYAMA